MIAIIDYGMGNLRSVQKAIERLGYEAVVTSDPETVKRAEGVILPGVGAFGDAMDNLKQLGMIEAIKQVTEEGTPFLGICLGMQLLFSTSDEHGMHAGLDLIPGHVRRFQGDFKIPHMGWNSLTLHTPSPILEQVKNGDYVYFVHSYYVDPADRRVVIASTDYHGEVPAMVQQNNIFGIQFHPEKSSDVGMQMLKNFARLVKDGVHA
jgi:glutamine amidotransferase